MCIENIYWSWHKSESRLWPSPQECPQWFFVASSIDFLFALLRTSLKYVDLVIRSCHHACFSIPTGSTIPKFLQKRTRQICLTLPSFFLGLCSSSGLLTSFSYSYHFSNFLIRTSSSLTFSFSFLTIVDSHCRIWISVFSSIKLWGFGVILTVLKCRYFHHLQLSFYHSRFIKYLQVLHVTTICTMPQLIHILATRKAFSHLGLDSLRKPIAKIRKSIKFAVKACCLRS